MWNLSLGPELTTQLLVFVLVLIKNTVNSLSPIYINWQLNQIIHFSFLHIVLGKVLTPLPRITG